MRYNNELFDQIKNSLDIVSIIQNTVSLKRKSNGDYLGLCPFHTEKTPSFTVNMRKKFFFCFGCNTNGDVIKFISRITNTSYINAALSLAKQHGIQIEDKFKTTKSEHQENQYILKSLNLAATFFASQLSIKQKQYLYNRSINEKLIKQFQLGYAPGKKYLLDYLEKNKIPLHIISKAGLINKDENNNVYEVFRQRIIFPIKNFYKEIIGFGARTMKDIQPKYLNSPETKVFKKSHSFFGEDYALSNTHKHNYVILVEGYCDVIALHSKNCINSLASLGTSISETHLKKLWQHVDEIILCLDQDVAGIRSTNKVINLALPLVTTQKQLSVIILPKDLDPDTAINKNRVNIYEYIENRLTLSQAILHYTKKQNSFVSVENKAKLEKNLLDYSNKITDPILRKNYYYFFLKSINNVTQKYRNKKDLSYYKKAATRSILGISTMSNNDSFISQIESSIIYFIIKNSNLISQHNSLIEEISMIEFKDKGNIELKDLIIEKIGSTISGSLNSKDLVDTLNTSKYKTFYEATLEEKSVLPKNQKEALVSFAILKKRHQIIVLKSELCQIKNTNDLTNNLKIQQYRTEILKINNEIKNLLTDTKDMF